MALGRIHIKQLCFSGEKSFLYLFLFVTKACYKYDANKLIQRNANHEAKHTSLYIININMKEQ